VGHVVVVVAMGVFIVLGLWQLNRLAERRDLNDLVSARMESSAARLDSLTDRHGYSEELEFRRTFVTGEYLSELELMYLLVSRNGQSGHVLLTPLQLSDTAQVVLVERGWVPADAEGPPVPGAGAPTGEVTVTGLLLDSDDRRRAGGSADLETRRITTFDRQVLDEAVPGELLPIIIRLEDQTPAPAPAPALMPGPVLTEGPHLGYAVQWFLFAGVVLVGYPILLYRTARTRNAGRSGDVAEA